MNDSDTESEPDNSLPKWNATDFAQNSIHVHHDQLHGDWRKNVQEAIELLSSIDAQSVTKDTAHHLDIQKASSAILSFIGDFISSEVSLDEAPQETLASFSFLLKVSFIGLLFEYRKAFHSLAAQQIPPGTAASSVICWVDVILSQLAAAVVSGGPTSDHSEFAKKNREDDSLRAAAQLPYEWKNVLGTISSVTASPAASRLALRLAFAVYVIGNQNLDDGSSSDNDRNHLQAILDIYIHQVPFSKPSDFQKTTSGLGFEIYVQERLNHAMVLAVFAVVEPLSSSRSKDTSRFHPYTSAVLLYCIQRVLHLDESGSDLKLTIPLLNLDLPQRVLLRWGQTVSWSWANWDDERVVGSESLIALTATWIYHIGNSETGLPWKVAIRSQLVKNPNAAAGATAMFLKKIIQNMTSCSPPDMETPAAVVLYKSVWIGTQLLDPLNEWPIPKSLDLVRCFLVLFALVQNIEREWDVKDMMLEGLTYAAGELFKAAFLSVQEDSRINFVMKIDRTISSTTRSLLGNHQDSQDPTAARQLLILLAIIWKSGTHGCLHRQTISSFLLSLIDLISAQKSTLMTLQSYLLTALTSLEEIKSTSVSTIINKAWNDDTIWLLAMISNPADLLTTSAFANYVISTAKNRTCDALCFAEAWDHLRDSLLLILAHHFLGDEEPFALVVVGSICQALSCLLRYADSKARCFMISSPWTMSLCDSLQSGMESTDQGDMYAAVLKERLLVHGLELKSRIAKILRPTPMPAPEATSAKPWSTRLMFCRIDNGSPYLLLVPQ